MVRFAFFFLKKKLTTTHLDAHTYTRNVRLLLLLRLLLYYQYTGKSNKIYYIAVGFEPTVYIPTANLIQFLRFFFYTNGNYYTGIILPRYPSAYDVALLYDIIMLLLLYYGTTHDALFVYILFIYFFFRF